MFAIFVSSVVVGIVLAGSMLFGAQQPQEAAVSPAPVPAQILSGKRVFIANAGEENLNTSFGPVLSGQSNRIYNQFYAAINGRAQLPALGHLRLAIRDPKTNVLLWTCIEYARFAYRKGNRDKNFDQAMGVIVDELKDLVRPSSTTAKP